MLPFLHDALIKDQFQVSSEELKGLGVLGLGGFGFLGLGFLGFRVLGFRVFRFWVLGLGFRV